jgi:hypothetical protein
LAADRLTEPPRVAANMESVLIPIVFQQSSWLKLSALPNMYIIDVTLLTSQELRSPLKLVAPLNIHSIHETLLTSQELRSPLKLPAL